MIKLSKRFKTTKKKLFADGGSSTSGIALYKTNCPRCDYPVLYTAAELVGGMGYKEVNKFSDIKCPMCLLKFNPEDRRPFGFSEALPIFNELTDVQKGYLQQMDAVMASAPGTYQDLKYKPEFLKISRGIQYPNNSILGTMIWARNNDSIQYLLVGHNLTPELLAKELGLVNIQQVPMKHIIEQMLNMPRNLTTMGIIL